MISALRPPNGSHATSNRSKPVCRRPRKSILQSLLTWPLNCNRSSLEFCRAQLHDYPSCLYRLQDRGHLCQIYRSDRLYRNRNCGVESFYHPRDHSRFPAPGCRVVRADAHPRVVRAAAHPARQQFLESSSFLVLRSAHFSQTPDCPRQFDTLVLTDLTKRHLTHTTPWGICALALSPALPAADSLRCS